MYPVPPFLYMVPGFLCTAQNLLDHLASGPNAHEFNGIVIKKPFLSMITPWNSVEGIARNVHFSVFPKRVILAPFKG